MWHTLILEPFFRPMPWGGERLRHWFGPRFPEREQIGEVWLVADHPVHASRVGTGPLRDHTLGQLRARDPIALVGKAVDRFPLLVKMLDASEHLSVQVHPDDESARIWAPQEGGKTEAWYVLEAAPGSFLLLGLKPGVDRSLVQRELATGTLPMCLERYQPKAGECYYVPAGTVHAIGAGLVLLEVQQTSDATFRLYDWDRRGADGRPRPLHIEAGLACLRERTQAGRVWPPAVRSADTVSVPRPQAPGTRRTSAPVAGAGDAQPARDQSASSIQLLACPYFALHLEQAERAYRWPAPGLGVLLQGALALDDGTVQADLEPGASWLVPAAAALPLLTPRICATWMRITWQ